MVSLELIDPGGNAGNVQIKHKDKGAEDLGLVLGGAARGRIKRGHELHDVVKVEKPRKQKKREVRKPWRFKG